MEELEDTRRLQVKFSFPTRPFAVMRPLTSLSTTTPIGSTSSGTTMRAYSSGSKHSSSSSGPRPVIVIRAGTSLAVPRGAGA